MNAYDYAYLQLFAESRFFIGDIPEILLYIEFIFQISFLNI